MDAPADGKGPGMSKAKVLTPKLWTTFAWWCDERVYSWLCRDQLSQLFELEEAEAIQVEISGKPLKGGYVFWFRNKHRWEFVHWGTTKAKARRDGDNIMYARAKQFLLKHFTITDKPTKLYVRVWLLTGKDAQDD